jgi:O-antigen/teichoic acid export membrane protein
MMRVLSRTKRMALVGYAAYLGRFGIGISTILVIPMLHRYLNPELFGVWMAIASFAAFFPLLDFGIGSSLMGLISKDIEKNKITIYKNINSSYILLILISLIIISFWVIFIYFFENKNIIIGNISNNNKESAFLGFSAFIFISTINIPASLIQKIQMALQHGYWVGYNQLIGSFFVIILSYLAVYFKLEFIYIVAATILPNLLVNFLLTVYYLRNHLKSFFLDLSSIRKFEYKNLVRNGIFFFVIQLASIVAFSSDAMVIPHLLGQEEYGQYAIIQKIFVVVSLAISSALSGLWPAISDAIASEDRRWVASICRKLFLSSFIFILIILVIINIFIDDILKMWIGDNFYKPSNFLIYLFSFWTLLEVAGILITAILNAFNILASQALIAIAMSFIIIYLKFVLLSIMGINGAIISTILGYSLISIPYQYLLLKKLCKEESICF